MVLREPEERVGDQEVAHLGAPVVEDERAPVGMRSAAGILVLVERRAVEAHERELVAREVRRHPVEDHAEAAGVQPVDEVAELVGRAVARRGRVVAGHLIAPGARERVLHDGHQLDVREAEVERVVRELVGLLRVRQRAVALQRVEPPGAEVHLVDRDRRRVRLDRPPALQPLGVGPAVMRLEDHRAGLRRQLGPQGDGIGLEADDAVGAADRELVGVARGRLGYEQLPDAGGTERPHRVCALVPDVEVADHADGAGSGRPDRERRSRGAVERARMRAERVPEPLVAALADEMEIELAERRERTSTRRARPRAPRRGRTTSRR